MLALLARGVYEEGELSNDCIVMYCIVLYCIVLYCIVMYCICLGSAFRNQVNLVGGLSSISGSCLEFLYCIGLYCIVLYCIVLYGIVLYGSVLYFICFGSTFRNQVNLVGHQLSAISPSFWNLAAAL